jgi:CheY-like chemotaxis protein
MSVPAAFDCPGRPAPACAAFAFTPPLSRIRRRMSITNIHTCTRQKLPPPRWKIALKSLKPFRRLPMYYWENMIKTRNIRTIVLIDDDIRLAKALEQVLVKSGFIVHAFINGRWALEWLAQERAELVITDIYMEHMDGMEIMGAVKKSYPAVKIIAMSGGSQIVDLDCLSVAKQLGADRTLTKPIQMTALLAAINELDTEIVADQVRLPGQGWRK